MSASSSQGLNLRTTLTLAALCVAMAACGGGGGGGGGGSAPAPAPAPTPTPPPPPPPPAPPTNTAPTAVISDVANGQLIGQAVTLTALSTDPDAGQTLTHTWALTERPNGSNAALSATSGTSITLTPDVVGTYAVRLISNDGIAESAAVTRTFTAAASNLPPVASIGGTTSGFRAGQVLTLNATSTDPEAQPLTHAWSLTAQPVGNTGALSSATGGSITFRPTAAGAYTVRLVSSDGVNASTPATVSFSIAVNQAPTAVIQATTGGVIAGQTVNFTAASTDPDSESLTHTWSLTAQPAGTPADALSAVSGSSTSLRPTRPGSYTVTLVSNDGVSSSPVATRTFSVTGNAVPSGTIGLAVTAGDAPSGQLAIGGTATLTANVTDPDSSPSPLTHTWSIAGFTPLVSGQTSSATLSGSTGLQVTFAPTVPGQYTIQLVSSDGLSSSSPILSVVTLNQVPTVGFTTTGSNGATIRVGETVTLASTATDPEGQVLTVAWTFTPPGGSLAALSSTTTPNSTFTPDVAGTYQVRLSVSDGVNPVQSAEISVPVLAQPAASACANPSGFAQGTSTRFNPTVAESLSAAGLVSTGSTGSNAGNSACFHRTVLEGVRGSDEIAPGTFQYFEVDTSRGDDQIAVGVGRANAPLTRNANGTWPLASPANDASYVVVTDGRVTNGTRTEFFLAEGATTYGLAVDYRERFPVVSVIGQPRVRPDMPERCIAAPGTPNTPKPFCVVSRFALNTTGPLRVYAYGRDSAPTDGTLSRVTINGGESAPYAVGPAALREALANAFLGGETGLNPQLLPTGTPAATALAQPAITTTSPLRTVVLAEPAVGGPSPQFTRTSLSVTAAGSTVEWIGPSGATLGTGATLDLLAARTALVGGATLPPGGTTYRIQAVATEIGAGTRAAMSNAVAFLVTVGAATDTDFDHDGDGLTFTQEIGATPATDPANPDTDGNGIGDGLAIVPSGPNTTVQLTREPNVTSSGIGLLDDRLNAAFTGLLSPECEAFPPAGVIANCDKRGIRSNVGVAPGEYRYFEVRRLTASITPNMGVGVIASTAAINAYNTTVPAPATPWFNLDPYCCFLGVPTDPATPPSITANFQGSFFRQLAFNNNWPAGSTKYLGVVIDYTAPPRVRVRFIYNGTPLPAVTPAVSEPIDLDFPTGSTVFPFLFGHPQAGTPVTLSQSVNFGLQRFFYNSGGRSLGTILSGSGGSGGLVPGIGIHQRPLTAE